jgi:hypothetical protein
MHLLGHPLQPEYGMYPVEAVALPRAVQTRDRVRRLSSRSSSDQETALALYAYVRQPGEMTEKKERAWR